MKTATFNGEDLFETEQTINYDEDTAADLTLAASGFATAVSSLDSKNDFANTSVTDIDTALDAVAALRAQNGSGQNRLQFTAQSLSLQRINMAAALSRIEDVDLAAETAELAKHSILTQASASMVAQANNQNDIALMLLS
jgi:flagellin